MGPPNGWELTRRAMTAPESCLSGSLLWLSVTCGHVPSRATLWLTFNLWPCVFVHFRSVRGLMVLLIVEFEHRKWSMHSCMYVGQWVFQGTDITQGHIWSSSTNISLLSYCVNECVHTCVLKCSVCNICFSRRCFEGGICKWSGMLLKFDTTLCSPVCLHHALPLPLIISELQSSKENSPLTNTVGIKWYSTL